MKRAELLESIRYVAGFYDMYVSIMAEPVNIPFYLNSLATLMWINEYQEDIHSKRIREQLENLRMFGSLIVDEKDNSNE